MPNIQQLARRNGIDSATLFWRLQHWKSEKEAISKPKRQYTRGLGKLCKENKISYHTVKYRLNQGVPLEVALRNNKAMAEDKPTEQPKPERKPRRRTSEIRVPSRSERWKQGKD